ncbi:MAG: insulinase family protein [Flavobacteriales bacterium]|nr:insulinase family protein [Flavobacteriales bacterium]
MSRIFIIILFVLSVTNVFSQIDSSNVGGLKDLDSLRKPGEYNVVNDYSDSSNVVAEKFYSISLDTTKSRPRPKDGEYKAFKMIKPQTFVLTNGLKVILVHNDKLPFVSYKMYFDFDEVLLDDKKGVDLIFNDLWGYGGRAFNNKNIEDHKYRTGTRIDVSEQSVFIEGLEKYKEKNLYILADLTLGMGFKEDKFQESKTKIIDSLYFNSNSNEYISETVAKNLMFGTKHPIGEMTLLENVDSLQKSDVYNYFKSYYNTNNSYLVVYGDITLKELNKSVEKYFGNYRKGNTISGYYPQPYNIHQTEIDYVENYNDDRLHVWMGNVEENNASRSNWIIGKVGDFVLLDEKEGLIYNELENGHTVSNLEHSLHDRGRYFYISYSVSKDSVALSVLKSIKVLDRALSDKTPENIDLEEVEGATIDAYVSGLMDAQKLSNLYLLYYLTGEDKYLVKNLMSVMDTVKYSTISRLLRQRIKPEQLRIVISGPPQVAVPKLEQLGYPIKYYDQHANPTFPPSLDRSVPDSVNVNDVINKYLNVIGGVDNLKSVKKLLQWWMLEIEGSKLYIKNKYMLPHKRLSTYSNNEIIVLKTVFNGEYGYVEKSGKRDPIIGKEFMRLSLEKSIYPEMYFQDDGYLMTLESQIPLRGEMCYKVRVESPIGDVSLLYFRISDGYLIRRDKIDKRTNELLNYFEYSDFKTFENLVFPYNVKTMIGDKKASLILTQIKLNDDRVLKRNFK